MGIGITAAVEDGWKRAMRTILQRKSINLLAAAVLYIWRTQREGLRVHARPDDHRSTCL